ncbi:recombinase [Proteus terrae]|uniref:recombinase n=1 Tax=Proteus terrae TaxID=1574161 RepID=UPI00301BF51F
MNSYNKYTDLQINELVATRLKKKCLLTEESVLAYMDSGYRTFDPCNNPTDAMPIIKDNFISITHDGIAWDVSCAKYPELSVWNGLENYNDNFYRKAMELFLLIKDAENENNNNS